MSEVMDVIPEGETNGAENNDCDMEDEEKLSANSDNKTENKDDEKCKDPRGTDVPDSRPNVFFPNGNSLKVQIPGVTIKTPSTELNYEAVNNSNESKNEKEKNTNKLSPPVLVNAQPFPRGLTSPTTPFQKPTVCRTHSLGAGDHSPFAIRRRPAKLPLSGQLRSPSAFRSRKLCLQSPIRNDLFDSDDNVLKRCNSAPMLNDINDMETQASWHHSSVAPGQIRARRFSATVLSVHASPSAGTAKSTSRLHQLKKEESLEGIQHKETAHEREVQNSIQMFNTCEELSLTDSTESLNGLMSGAGDGTTHKTPVTSHGGTELPRSPLPSSAPVSIPAINKQCPTRAIDFSLAVNGAALHTHHPGGGGIPSPLTISPSGCPLSLSPLPPSPTRGLGIFSTGKQCFSPSMQAPLYAGLRPGSLSPSPSPTRRNFVTRRRSQSPHILKPSALGPIKRKYDSDSEGGGCSPKRMFIPGSHNIGNHHMNSNGDSLAPGVITPCFARTIHRSHSLSSSSIDSDINVSPSPPQNGVNQGFLSSNHPHLRDTNSGSPFQSHNPFLGPGTTQSEVGRCSSPASSTCSSSSLEGLKDLQPFTQNHLNVQNHGSNNINSVLIKSSIKEQQSSIVSPATSTANVSL